MGDLILIAGVYFFVRSWSDFGHPKTAGIFAIIWAFIFALIYLSSIGGGY